MLVVLMMKIDWGRGGKWVVVGMVAMLLIWLMIVVVVVVVVVDLDVEVSWQLKSPILMVSGLRVGINHQIALIISTQSVYWPHNMPPRAPVDGYRPIAGRLVRQMGVLLMYSFLQYQLGHNGHKY